MKDLRDDGMNEFGHNVGYNCYILTVINGDVTSNFLKV